MFQCARPRTTVLPYKMHILGLKWHSKFSRAGVFSSIKPPKNSKQKNNSTPFEAHMQETMQFTAYLQGFVNI